MRRALLGLLCAGLLLLVGCRAESSSGSLYGPTSTPVTPLPWLAPTAAAAGNVPHLQAGELRERLQLGEAIVVVDARSRAEYEQEHISGAISVPVDEMAGHIGEFPRDHLIVFY